MPPAASADSTAAALASVLTPDFLRKLDRLRLRVRGSSSPRPGTTLVPRRTQASGIELETHKAYGPGDDLRHLDWNAYGRLGQLLIKTYRAEREAPLHIIVDASASMAVPGSDGKPAFACSLAASLGYISLRHNDPVRIVAVSADWPDCHLASPFFRHRDALQHLRAFLAQLRPRGETALAGGIAAALRAHRTPGIAILLSDFLVEPAAYESALAALVARGLGVAALRVIGPAERDPSRLFHRGHLIDAESGRQRFVTLGPENTQRYADALAQHLAGLERFCGRCGITFALADTSRGVERHLFEDLPALGLLH